MLLTNSNSGGVIMFLYRFSKKYILLLYAQSDLIFSGIEFSPKLAIFFLELILRKYESAAVNATDKVFT